MISYSLLLNTRENRRQRIFLHTIIAHSIIGTKQEKYIFLNTNTFNNLYNIHICKKSLVIKIALLYLVSLECGVKNRMLYTSLYVAVT